MRLTSKIFVYRAPGGLHPPHEDPSYLSLCPQWHTWGDPLLGSPRSPPAGRICCRWSASTGCRRSEMPPCCFDRLKSPSLRILAGLPSSLCLSPAISQQQPPPFILCSQSTGSVSRHASGVLIGVALAFYTSRHCVIFGNRVEKRAPGFFFFLSFFPHTHSTADVIRNE